MLIYNHYNDSVIVGAHLIAPNIYEVDMTAFNNFLNPNTDDLSFGNWICLSYNVIPLCGYANEGMPEVSFSGITFCGDTSDTALANLDQWSPAGNNCGVPCGAGMEVFINQFDSVCSGDLLLKAIVTGGVAPYTYNWSNGDSTETTLVNLVSDSIFWVIVTDVYGQVDTDSVALSVLPYVNCCVPEGFIFGDTTNSYFNLSQRSASSLGNDSISYAVMIMINDTFTIDIPVFTFDHCPDIVLGPDAVIDVLPGDTLNIISSTLYSCDELWSSIRLRDSSSAVIIKYDSNIYDGDTAVKAHQGGFVSVAGSSFDKNYVGISMKTAKSRLLIDGVGFNCTDVLKGHIHGYTDTHVLLTEAGVIKIGDDSLGLNVFINATKGIDGLRTQLTVENAEIFIDTTVIPSPDSATFGIKHIGSGGTSLGAIYSLTVGDSANEKVTFRNYGYGTYSKYFTVNDIKNNEFENCNYGVYQEKIRAANSNVLYNTFIGCKKLAVYWYDVSINQGYAHINFNNINWGVSDTSNVAIRVESIASYQTNVTVVYNNISRSRYGVHLRLTEQLDASNNTIEFPQTIDSTSDEHIGMLIEKCTNNYLSGNTIYSLSTPQSGWQNLLRGMSMDMSTGNIVRENTFQKMGAGFRVNMNCRPSYLYCNVFDTCLFSVYYNNAGSMGHQGDTLDPWDNVFQGNIDSLKFDGDTISTHVRSTWFFRGIDTVTTNIYSTQPSNPNLVNPIDSVNFDTLKCERIDTSHGGGDHSGSFAQMVSNNDYDSSAYENEIRYMDKSTVYQALNEDSSLMNQDAPTDEVLQDFYNENIESNIGKFEEVRSLSEEGAVDSAIEQNDDIVDTNLIEYNSKVVNEIYLAATENDTLYLTPSQISTLESIAYQNPMEGGEAVYRARAMLRLYIGNASSSGMRKGRSEINKLAESFANKFRIYPNPAGDYFVIRQLNGFEKEKIELRLFDNSGRMVMKRLIFITSLVRFPVAELVQGAYKIQIKYSDSTEVHKLIIVR